MENRSKVSENDFTDTQNERGRREGNYLLNQPRKREGTPSLPQYRCQGVSGQSPTPKNWAKGG